MDTTSTAPDQLFGYQVSDDSGNKIGTVDSMWVDVATDQLEFFGVKTAWILGKTHLIPAAGAQISEGTITVPFPASLIKDAPSYPADYELNPTEENKIYGYYGDQRSIRESPTGVADPNTLGRETPEAELAHDKPREWYKSDGTAMGSDGTRLRRVVQKAK